MVPQPFSRCVFIYGEQVRMDPDKDASGDLARVQAEMDRVVAEAEGYFKS
jgi:lysophospholipid acyltransferase (LPLAT)-like uncharacterized protein